jgi:CRISPR-associated protein Cas1
MYSEDDLIPLSALQHLLFCERQCALIHVEQMWNENLFTAEGAYLTEDGETVVVKVEKEIRLRIPIHTIGGIVCFGNIMCSPFLMGFCAERDVAISFLTEHGRFLARVQGPVSGNFLLRREQYRRADDMNASAEMARAVLTGKLANCRTVLGRALRDHSDKLNVDEVREASQRINSSLRL